VSRRAARCVPALLALAVALGSAACSDEPTANSTASETIAPPDTAASSSEDVEAPSTAPENSTTAPVAPAADPSGESTTNESPATTVTPGAETRVAIPTGAFSEATDGVYVVNDEGTLFTNPGLLVDAGASPQRVVRVGGDTTVSRVAGVVDGSIVFATCCDAGSGVFAVSNADAAPSRFADGISAALDPDGTRLVIAEPYAVSVFDTSTGSGARADVQPGVEVSDVLWVDGRPVVLVHRGDERALAAVDQTTGELSDPVVIESELATTAEVAIAGEGPNGEVALTFDDGTDVVLRAFDPPSFALVDRLNRQLPPGVDSVRVTKAGDLIWVDQGALWFKPSGATETRPLGGGSAAAWLAPNANAT
jgi:hypothetical protein